MCVYATQPHGVYGFRDDIIVATTRIETVRRHNEKNQTDTVEPYESKEVEECCAEGISEVVRDVLRHSKALRLRLIIHNSHKASADCSEVLRRVPPLQLSANRVSTRWA